MLVFSATTNQGTLLDVLNQKYLNVKENTE